MSDDWKSDEDDEDDGDPDYESDIEEYGVPTEHKPKFKKIDSMQLATYQLTEMRVDDLTAMYVAARNQLATDRRGYNARELAVKTHLATISMQLRDRGDRMGVDSFSTPSGTAYRKRTEKFRVGVWDSLVAYIKKTDNFQILQKRVSPNAVREIRDTDGLMPDGVDALVEETFAVRSPTARKSKT